MPYQRISVTDKERLYAAHQRGEDYIELAKQLGIKRSTAWAIVDRAQKRGGQVAIPRGGLRPTCQIVDDDLIRAAVAVVEEHPEYTLNQIIEEICTQLPNHRRLWRI